MHENLKKTLSPLELADTFGVIANTGNNLLWQSKQRCPRSTLQKRGKEKIKQETWIYWLWQKAEYLVMLIKLLNLGEEKLGQRGRNKKKHKNYIRIFILWVNLSSWHKDESSTIKMDTRFLYITIIIYNSSKCSWRSQISSSFNLKCDLASQNRTVGKTKFLQE